MPSHPNALGEVAEAPAIQALAKYTVMPALAGLASLTQAPALLVPPRPGLQWGHSQSGTVRLLSAFFVKHLRKKRGGRWADP